MRDRELYYIWYDKIKSKEQGGQVEDFMVLQCRGEFPYAHIRMTRLEAMQLMQDLQEVIESWQ